MSEKRLHELEREVADLKELATQLKAYGVTKLGEWDRPTGAPAPFPGDAWIKSLCRIFARK